jgi:NADH-quinone oxidoreductase subunit H
VRETIRLLVQQRRTTIAADSLLWRTGVVLLPVAAVLAALVLPLGFRSAGDLGVGVVWFNAMEVLAWSAVWLVGWGPNSPFALIGGYRFVVQGLAYELPHMLSLITAALAAESLQIGGIVEAQAELWYVVWMPLAFALYLLSALAMAFWGPFDHPLSADVAGGATAELSGVDRLLFSGGRRLLFVVAAAMSVPLFLGGGQGPLLPPWLWTLLKTAAVLGLLAALRRRLPTLRMGRYAELAWVVLVPLAILQALVVAIVVLER